MTKSLLLSLRYISIRRFIIVLVFSLRPPPFFDPLESPELKQEEKVRAQIQAMKDALTVFSKRNDEGSWKKSIEERQRKVYKARKEKRALKQSRLIQAEKYDIVCRQCKALITSAERILKVRETNHHILTGDGIEDVVISGPFDEEHNDHGDEVERLHG